MNRLLLSVVLFASACVMDRTGQSATEQYRREMALHGQRLTTLEGQVDRAEQRVAQLEEINRARGQQELQRMESIDEVRAAVGKIQGDIDTLRHETTLSTKDSATRTEDATFRLTWLELRAEALEKNLGIKPPPAPTKEGVTSGPPAGGGTAVATTNGGTPAPEETQVAVKETNPDDMMALIEKQLADGKDKAAIAVAERFITLHPDHKRVPEAMYRRAEGELNAKNYSQAVLRFQEVIDKHKSSPWAAYAMLRQGECFEAQGQKDNARLFYEDVVRLYPKSKAAKEAKAKLGK